VVGVAVYKVNISLPEGLVSEIDEAAGELGLTRSGFVAEASVRYVADVKNLTAEEQRRKDIQRAIDGFRRIRESHPADYDYDYLAQIRADRERDTPEGQKR
jgi:metal-responsive CopG/Arc/MetJ family transcriptional regulator